MPTFSRKTLFFLSIMLVLAGALFYFYQQSREVISGPQLTVNAPANGATIEESVAEIAGKTEHVSELTINGRAIFVDEEGRFSEPLLLLPGYNIIEVNAVGRFGKKESEVLELVKK